MKKLFIKCKNFYMSLWQSKLKLFILLALIMVVTFICVASYASYKGGVLQFNTDDILQYYPYVSGLFTKIKEGNLSLYDTTLFGGSSFFSGVYYLPFDIFTLISFLLSFIMDNMFAYFITNFFRPICGALILYYVLIRKGMKLKTAFFTSLIYFVGGMTQAFFVFPVYLGISFYIPLGMLLIDLCVEKKGVWYLTLPIFSVLVILYDFYIAYIILAFIVLYFIIEMHITDKFSFFGKNSFIKNKNFWIRFFEMLSLVILGVGMAAFFILPSAAYIMEYSSRTSAVYENSLWFFESYDSVAKEYNISLEHYFTNILTFFMPNDPDRLMLGGHYKTNHVTFYLTNGGFLFLSYFFLLKGKTNNRLKFWVLFINLLFLMPIFSMIFTFTTEPYTRWFFIPYMVNLYAMARGMDDNGLELNKSKIIKLITIIALGLALYYVIYGMNHTELWIDYDKKYPIFDIIANSALIFISIYIAILAISLILSFITKRNIRIVKILSPIVICAEIIFSIYIIYQNVGNATPYYQEAEDSMLNVKEDIESVGYNKNDGYRINYVSSYSLFAYNANTWVGDINFGRFFQSFYTPSLDICMEDIYYEPKMSWNRTYNNVYSLTNGSLFNMKYIVFSTDKFVDLPKEYYGDPINIDNNWYYTLESAQPFIVYDKAYTGVNNSNIVKMQYAALKYAYVKDPKIEDPNTIKDEAIKSQYDLLQYYKENEIEFIDGISIDNELKNIDPIVTCNLSTCKAPDELKNFESSYFIYDLTKYRSLYENKDIIEFYSNVKDNRNNNSIDSFVYDTEGKWHRLHYNTLYLDDSWEPKYLMIKPKDMKSSANLTAYMYSYDLYDDYINTQSQYKDKYFSLDGDTMHIKCTMPNSDYNRIIKTGYAYSDEWIVTNGNYKTIDVNGGFLGIIIPKGTTNVNITLRYEPLGYYFGCKISLISSIIYLTIAIPTIVVIRKRNRKYEKDINNRSML